MPISVSSNFIPLLSLPRLIRRPVSVYRKLCQPLTLSNGTTLPKDSYVAVPGSVYSRLAGDGTERSFDGFQWAELKRTTSDAASKFNYSFSGQVVRKWASASANFPSPDSLEFGAGSHACPGRHFAVMVLKATLSRILTRYDLRLPVGSQRPPDRFNHLFDLVANPHAALELSRRAI